MSAERADFQGSEGDLPDRTRREGARADLVFDLLQEYVDGTLDDKRALRLHLQAERDPALAAELAATRALFSALDGLERAEPSAAFDQAVLERVPLERYRSAPRRAPRALRIGDPSPTLAERTVRPFGRALLAGFAAWILVLVVGRTALQRVLDRGAESLAGRLAEWAASTEHTPILSGLVAGLARLYATLVSAGSALAGWIGPGNAIVLSGALLGMIALGVWQRSRRSDHGSIGIED